MKWIIKRVMPEHTTWDGVHYDYQEVEVEIPFNSGADVYYVYRKKRWKRNSPYVVKKCSVTGVWATNMVGVILDGTNHVGDDEFDRLFTDKEEAIELCLKLNTYRKVKIYGENT